MAKKNLIIIAAVLFVAAFAVMSFSKKSEPKYTMAQVRKGDILQTVSATGAVEAAKKLDLNFVNSGRVQEINVKVGDNVEDGRQLAKLDTAQLDSQLAQAVAMLNSALADLNKLIEGATVEDIKLSETTVENAKIALDNANRSLYDTQSSAEKDIASSQASLDSAKTTLSNAEVSLSNTKIANENSLNEDYDSAWDTVNAGLVTASTSLTTNKTTLESDDAEDTLSVLNLQYLNYAQSSKLVAEASYGAAKAYSAGIGSIPSDENINNALIKTKKALEDIRIALSDTNDVLGATITSTKLSQSELDVLRTNVSTARTNTNAAITSITSAQQAITAQSITNQTNLDNAQAAVNSANSAVDLAEQNLASAQSAAAAKINAAQNAVKTADGALKQAQDQLALKKAGPRKSDIDFYEAQVKKARASVDLIQSQIGDSLLFSPQKGIVTEINGEIGELSTPTKIFMSIITADNFEIKANISEVDIAKVKIEDEVDITFDALGLDKKFTGKIASIDPAQTEVSGVIYYKVTAMFSGDAKIVKPGMTANLDIMTARRENTLMIPFQALKEDGTRKFVQIVENGELKDVDVEIGLKGDVDVEILQGLSEGQSIVTFVEALK